MIACLWISLSVGRALPKAKSCRSKSPSPKVALLLLAHERFFHRVFFVLFLVAFALVEFRDVVNHDAIGGV